MRFILPVKQTAASHAPPIFLDFTVKSCLERSTMNLTSGAALIFFFFFSGFDVFEVGLGPRQASLLE